MHIIREHILSSKHRFQGSVNIPRIPPNVHVYFALILPLRSSITKGGFELEPSLRFEPPSRTASQVSLPLSIKTEWQTNLWINIIQGSLLFKYRWSFFKTLYQQLKHFIYPTARLHNRLTDFLKIQMSWPWTQGARLHPLVLFHHYFPMFIYKTTTIKKITRLHMLSLKKSF